MSSLRVTKPPEFWMKCLLPEIQKMHLEREKISNWEVGLNQRSSTISSSLPAAQNEAISAKISHLK